MRSPYIFGYFGSPAGTGTCASGIVYAYINNYTSGQNVFQTGQGRGIIYFQFFVESPSGVIDTFCGYYENVDGQLGNDTNLIPQCVYGTDPMPGLDTAMNAC